MAEFRFYRQQRQDGGIRTGIDLNDELCWHLFEPGTEPEDPALRWYVDLRGEGAAVPDDPEELREWLIQNADEIRSGFEKLADRLSAGLDSEAWPLRWELQTASNDVSLEIVLSAARRLDALQIAETLREIGYAWTRLVQTLQPMIANP